MQKFANSDMWKGFKIYKNKTKQNKTAVTRDGQCEYLTMLSGLE